MILHKFSGDNLQHAREWIEQFEQLCAQEKGCDRDERLLGSALSDGMEQNVTVVLKKLSESLEKIKGRPFVWRWSTFKVALVCVDDQIKKQRSILRKFQDFRAEHPTASKVAAIGLAGLAAIPLVPAVLLGGLNLIGFSAAGPVAGSIAAGMQASYGGAVASGSAFALAQSAAMGGIAVSGAGVVAGTAAVGASSALNLQSRKSESPWPLEYHASPDVLYEILCADNAKERKSKL